LANVARSIRGSLASDESFVIIKEIEFVGMQSKQNKKPVTNSFSFDSATIDAAIVLLRAKHHLDLDTRNATTFVLSTDGLR
jgi:mannose/fructose/N-acetylgalactosamine-specific phosphotransferase system component IIB